MEIDYEKIKWDAATNWEFCGTKENLRTVWNRYWERFGVRVPIDEFAYKRPRKGLAFKVGDVVIYRPPQQAPRYAMVTDPCGGNEYFYIRLANGDSAVVHPSNIPSYVAISDIPDELVALARAVADKSTDPSKCPLEKPACVGD